jgi:hypothetical protein
VALLNDIERTIAGMVAQHIPDGWSIAPMSGDDFFQLDVVDSPQSGEPWMAGRHQIACIQYFYPIVRVFWWKGGALPATKGENGETTAIATELTSAQWDLNHPDSLSEFEGWLKVMRELMGRW